MPVRPALFVAVSAVAALHAGCRPDPEPGPWERHALAEHPPAILSAPPGGGEAVAAVATPLGPAVIEETEGRARARDLPPLAAARVGALRQAPGSRLAWEIPLGEEPLFSFRPLADAAGCRPATEVLVRPGGGGREQSIYRGRPGAGPSRAAPEEEVVPLAEWAGQTIELVLAVAGDGAAEACAALWGTPVVWSRGDAASVAAAGGEPAERPDIVLIGADTLRADALGAWGRDPSITPALDALAAESDVWTGAYATFNATNPSFASLLTGLYGRRHGVYDLATPLPDDHATLPELLREAGYSTFAAIAVQHLRPATSGLGQGFDRVAVTKGQAAAELAVDQALEWIAETSRDRPFFVWLHLFDPHTPHTPPEPYATGISPAEPPGVAPAALWRAFRPPGPVDYEEPFLAAHEELYAGEVAYLDREVGRLVAALRSRDGLAGTLVAFTADHGENFVEHGVRFRHAGLFESTTHVPLMVRWPGTTSRGRRHPGLVQHFDLFPTLLKAAGIAPPQTDATALEELGGKGRPAVFSEHSDRLGAAIRTPRFRYYRSLEDPAVVQLVPPGIYLFDLAADPEETRNLAGTGLPEEGRLAAALDAWLAARPAAAPLERRELTPEEEEQLRALGYL